MPAAFHHRQRVAFKKLNADLTEGWEIAEVRANKRDLRPLGYWLVRFADGGELCIHETNLKAA